MKGTIQISIPMSAAQRRWIKRRLKVLKVRKCSGHESVSGLT